MEKYKDFMNQIPDDIIQQVDRTFCNEVAIFKPDRFISGIRMNSSDYHIIVPTVAPPDTYINDTLEVFDRGRLIVFNPGDSIYCAYSKPTKPYLTILIKPDMIKRIADEMDVSGEVRFNNSQNYISDEIQQLIKLFDNESMRPDRSTLMLDCMSIHITALMVREMKSNVKKYNDSSPENNVGINMAINYINEYCCSNITIDDICNEINISPFHFIRTFKDKTGLTPHRYLLNVRIKKAMQYLHSGQFTVTEVAQLCGFVNLSHFSKTFKDITGISPIKYLSTLI